LAAANLIGSWQDDGTFILHCCHRGYPDAPRFWGQHDRPWKSTKGRDVDFCSAQHFAGETAGLPSLRFVSRDVSKSATGRIARFWQRMAALQHLRYNTLDWNTHSASSRLALRPH
jgi:hypothetical protein